MTDNPEQRRITELEFALKQIERKARLVAHDLTGRVESGKVLAVLSCADIARATLDGDDND